MQRENFGPSTSILIASRGQSDSRTPGPGGLYQIAQHKLGGDTAPKKMQRWLGIGIFVILYGQQQVYFLIRMSKEQVSWREIFRIKNK